MPVDNYYNEIENSEEPNLEIPVNKILAMQTTWPVEGKSVYDLFMGKTNDGKDEAAFKAHLVSLKKYGLDYQITSYAGKQNLDGDRPICFNYYKEDDWLYPAKKWRPPYNCCEDVQCASHVRYRDYL